MVAIAIGDSKAVPISDNGFAPCRRIRNRPTLGQLRRCLR
jgi:hypothetical protein